MADAPSSPDFPPFPIRKRLLTDFIEVHECSFQSAFSSALILEGGIDNFPFDERMIFVMLKYRPDCAENPAVAFSVLGCTWTTISEVTALFGPPDPAGEALDRMVDTNARAKHSGYRGLLRVFFKMEDHMVRESYPQSHLLGPVGDVHRAYIATVDHTQWATRVQQFVRDGLAMRQPNENVLMMQLGRLKMKKGKWVWVQLTREELVQWGYPADFPGLLF
ncbi:hypothetical protein B0H15DRAFT_954792 [Mycena belliarum]|uniref:Uncharacterized protein n=1 Tax=Mycena belliarum TaxID=1033014 RepID=A0AAD6TXS3_9AGAR|nr:hypothetical protein B0H15DRAFT_954792 [Mycena belliae]